MWERDFSEPQRRSGDERESAAKKAEGVLTTVVAAALVLVLEEGDGEEWRSSSDGSLEKA